jgi:N5-(cytidine 5'-diphosphoramidyl)-L-glutamine hydrolase
MKPIIGISLRITNAKKYVEKRDSLSHDWPILLEQLGFSPLLIPNTLLDIPTFLNEMNVTGLILSGGDNMGDDPLRDKIEKTIIHFAISNNIPLIGICRGMQVINSFFGGKIHNLENSIHVNVHHGVNLKNNFLINDKNIKVNSFHHNVVDQINLGKNLSPFAVSEIDNTVEGFFHNELQIFGVMWHPERYPDNNSNELFHKIFTKKELL